MLVLVLSVIYETEKIKLRGSKQLLRLSQILLLIVKFDIPQLALWHHGKEKILDNFTNCCFYIFIIIIYKK